MMWSSLLLVGFIIYVICAFDLPRIYLCFILPLLFIKEGSQVGIVLVCFLGTLLLRAIVKKIIQLYKERHDEDLYYYYPVFNAEDQLQFKKISIKTYQKSLMARRKAQPVASERNNKKELVFFKT